MKKINYLHNLVNENHGYLKTSDAVEAGISRSYIMDYVKEYGLERLAQGLYRTEEAWDDGMYVLQTRYPKAVFSHESALYLFDLAVREPIQYSITLPAGSGSATLASEGIKVYKIKHELFEIGLTNARTPAGHFVRVYNEERTICDLLRSRSTVDIQHLQHAMNEYIGRNSRNISKLAQYSEKFAVDKILRTYLEVLLP